MEATQAQSPHSEAAPAAPQPGVSSSSGTALQPTQSTGILELPDVLVKLILEEALTKDPSSFKLLLMVCRSWASSAPVLRLHLRIHEGAQIPGALLAEGMERLSEVVSLRLQRGSVRGQLPTINTPSGAAEDPSRHQAPWTSNVESLTVDHVEFVPADLSLAFPSLTQLSLAFSDEDGKELPSWVEDRFPPHLQSLRLCNMSDGSVEPSEQPIPEYRGFPSSLLSLHLSHLSDRFFSSSLGELALLKHLTIYRCAFEELPESIGNLRRLQHLTFKNCCELSTLPESISNLISLSSLQLLKSELVRLPELGPNLHKSLLVFQHSEGRHGEGPGLEGLEEGYPLDLTRCLNIRTLHLECDYIDRMPNLGRLRNLQDLHLQSRKIKRVPNLGGLSNLHNLLLDLPKAKKLPDVFSTLPSLKSVRILCNQLLTVPPSLTASTSSSLEVLHINCAKELVLPSLACPQNLLELKLVGRIVGSSQADTALGTPAHHHPPHVTLNPAIKKVHVTSCNLRMEGACTLLEELGLFCDKKGCHDLGMTHGDIWGDGGVPPLPSLTRLLLWCGAEDQKCYHSWVTRLAPLPGLRVLQIGPHRRLRVEADFSLSPEGHLDMEALKLHDSDWRTPSSLPSLLTCLSAAGGALTRLKDLVLSDRNLIEAPDFLEELRGLVSFTVRGCYQLRRLNLPPTWTSLESLHISWCTKLRSRADMLEHLVSLKTLVLGCSLMVEDPPSLAALQELTSFEVVDEGWNRSSHVCHPLCVWNLPSLKRVKAPVECLRELPNVPILPSVESLELGDLGSFVSLPRAEGSGLPRQMKQDLREARERLRSRTELTTDTLPLLVWDCLTQLTSLHVERLRPSPSGLHLPSNLTMLNELTHLKVTDSDMEAIPAEVASLPHLLKLELRNCPRLKVIHGASDGYGTLREITIEDCPLLEAWPDVVTNR